MLLRRSFRSRMNKVGNRDVQNSKPLDEKLCLTLSREGVMQNPSTSGRKRFRKITLIQSEFRVRQAAGTEILADKWAYFGRARRIILFHENRKTFKLQQITKPAPELPKEVMSSRKRNPITVARSASTICQEL